MDANLAAILANYEKNKANTGSTGTKQVDLSNYFSTFLPKGTKEATRKIRLLPDGLFTKVHVHSKKVDGQYRKLVCPQKEKGEDCPFCEAHDLLMAKNTDDHRKLAYQHKARQTYVVKVIDREKEDEGIKFWRFNHSRQEDGIYDQIIAIMTEAGADISNPVQGRDLTIKISRNQMNIPVVSSIIPSFVETPLSSNAALSEEWLNDKRTWEDVYALKPYEYLRILVQDGIPVWDKDSNGYVDKAEKEASDSQPKNDDSDLQNELTLGTPEKKSPSPESVKTTPASTPVNAEVTPESIDEEEDDLPF